MKRSLRNDFENKINIVIVACTQNERNPKTNCEKEKHIKIVSFSEFFGLFFVVVLFFYSIAI